MSSKLTRVGSGKTASTLIILALATMLSCCGTHGDPVIQLRRTRCFGTCPAYTVKVTGDGSVIFKGFHYVRAFGYRSGQIAPDALEALAMEAVSEGFMELTQEQVDDCREIFTDAPSAFLTVRADGRENSIEHYHGCRGREIHEMLTRLERRVDEVLQTSKWVDP